jgi:hypothetical protein
MFAHNQQKNKRYGNNKGKDERANHVPQRDLF